MKAVITLTADAAGVQAGVTRALRQLDKLRQSVMDIRNMFLVGVLENMVRNLFGSATSELDRLKGLAETFDPQAAMSAAQLSLAKLQADMQLGHGFGPTATAINQQAVRALDDRTKRLMENVDKVSLAMILWASVVEAWHDRIADMLIAIGTLTDLIFRLSDYIRDPRGQISKAMVSDPLLHANMAATPVIGSMVMGSQNTAAGLTLLGILLEDVKVLLREKLGGS
jgi:hypothetical protein